MKIERLLLTTALYVALAIVVGGAVDFCLAWSGICSRCNELVIVNTCSGIRDGKTGAQATPEPCKLNDTGLHGCIFTPSLVATCANFYKCQGQTVDNGTYCEEYGGTRGCSYVQANNPNVFYIPE